MDFVTKALGSLSGLPFTLGDKLEVDPSFPQLFTLYKGTIKKTSAPCTRFTYTCSDPDRTKLANRAVSALKRLRVPGIIRLVDSVESGTYVYILTEPVTPLVEVLPSLTPSARKWMLHSVLETISSLHGLKCTHGSLSAGNIFQNSQGLWVVGGLELSSTPDELEGSSLAAAPLLPCASAIAPPEGWSAAKEIDTYQFGVLMRHVLPMASRLIQTLTAAKRPSLTKVNGSTVATSALKSPITEIADMVAQSVLMSDLDFASFLSLVQRNSTDLPKQFVYGSLLPHMVKRGAERGGIENITTILTLAAEKLSATEFEAPFPSEEMSMVTFLGTLFKSMDRAVRLELLQKMPLYLPLISDKVVQTQILPAMTTGFVDTEVRLRVASVESVTQLAPRLTDRQRNGELLRLLARTHNDVDPAVRALTTKTLCEVAPLLESRNAVVATALGKSLKDPTAEVRIAALNGVQQTSASLEAREVAEKLVGPAALAVLDKDPDVASEAVNVLDALVLKVKAAAGHASQAPSRAPSRTASATPSASTPSAPLTKTFETPGSGPEMVPATLAPANRPAFGVVSGRGARVTESPPITLKATTVLPPGSPVTSPILDDELGADDGWGWGDDAPDETKAAEDVEDSWGW